MKNFYICAPVVPRDRFDINSITAEAIESLKKTFGTDVADDALISSSMEILNSRSGDDAVSYYLNDRPYGKVMLNISKMIDDIAWSDMCYFTPDWNGSVECRIARNVCLELGVPIYDNVNGALVKYNKDTTNDGRANMHTVFISVPMSGRANSDVRMDIARATRIIKKIFDDAGKEVNIMHNFDCVVGPPEDCVHLVTNSLRYLGEAVHQMAFCDMVFFCDGWEKSPGCNIEREICKRYNIKIIDEDAADAAAVSKSL